MRSSAGDIAARDELGAALARHRVAIERYALRRVPADDVADVVGEVFATAWRRAAAESLPEPALPWLYGIARKVIANFYRGRARRAGLQVLLESQPEAADQPLADDVCARLDLAQALHRLSSDDQEVPALVAWEGLTAAEAARVLGCSTSAFVMRLHRARRRLERHLHEDRRNASTPATVRQQAPTTEGVT